MCGPGCSLYSAIDVQNKLAHLERSMSGFRPPELLNEPNSELYISLLAGENRPARDRLPALPTFPSRPAVSRTMSSQASGCRAVPDGAEDDPRPNKRQLLALEYLYGRAVGVDECVYLAEKEPAMWQLVKVAAAVAEVNEWMRRVARDRSGPSRSPTAHHQPVRAGSGSGSGSASGSRGRSTMWSPHGWRW